MCPNHHQQFDNLQFFIRYVPNIKKYIFIHYDSYGSCWELDQYHGKAVALDPKDHHAPLPLLFLVHEFRCRGRNFYQPTSDLKFVGSWQGWIVNRGVLDEGDDGSFTFKRAGPTRGSGPRRGGWPTNVQTSPTAVPSGSQFIILPPTPDLVEELLASQHSMPSWKAAQMESMGWEGTTEDNVKRYLENVDVEETAQG